MPRSSVLLPDWIFGAEGKRLVLDRVIGDGEGRTWTEPLICAAVEKDRHSSLGKHLEALTQMGLMRKHLGRPTQYELIPMDQLDEPRRRIRSSLETLLPPLRELPAVRVPPDAKTDR